MNPFDYSTFKFSPFAESELVSQATERLTNTIHQMLVNDRQRSEANFNAILAAVLQKYAKEPVYEIRLSAAKVIELSGKVKFVHHIDRETGEHVFTPSTLIEGPKYGE